MTNHENTLKIEKKNEPAVVESSYPFIHQQKMAGRKVLFCMRCGQAISSEMQFCPGCAGELAVAIDPDATIRICAICDQYVPIAAKFCPFCGSATDSEEQGRLLIRSEAQMLGNTEKVCDDDDLQTRTVYASPMRLVYASPMPDPLPRPEPAQNEKESATIEKNSFWARLFKKK